MRLEELTEEEGQSVCFIDITLLLDRGVAMVVKSRMNASSIRNCHPTSAGSESIVLDIQLERDVCGVPSARLGFHLAHARSGNTCLNLEMYALGPIVPVGARNLDHRVIWNRGVIRDGEGGVNSSESIVRQ